MVPADISRDSKLGRGHFLTRHFQFCIIILSFDATLTEILTSSVGKLRMQVQSAPKELQCITFGGGGTVANSGSWQTAPFNFQLLLLGSDCLYEISESTFKVTFSVIISILFSHDANILQEDLI